MKPLLVVASHNKHKIQEIKELTQGLSFKVVGLGELGDYPEVEEDGDTFHANARKKALVIAKELGEWVLADDSGLEVDALNGAPGVHSARFAGEPSDDERNNQLLLEKMKEVEIGQRGAQFRCVMALASPKGEVEFAEGICRGIIAQKPAGAGGFGYDPLFLIPDYGKTFAQLGAEVKNKISHRYLTMQGMLAVLRSLE